MERKDGQAGCRSKSERHSEVRIDELKAHPENPRIISEAQLERLAKSLDKFGDLSGIVYNIRTQRLVGGHQRVKKLPPSSEIHAKRLAEPTRTGTVALGHVDVNGEKFVYREVDWDDDTEKAANLAANQHGGDFDMSKVNEWLTDLDMKGFDIDLTGFEKSDIVPVQKEGLCDEDEIPEHVEPKSKLGDLYVLGNHRLLCGDSTSIDAVERLMNGEKADMVFTDPPYGISIVGGGKSFGSVGGGKIVKANNYAPVIGDETTDTARDVYNLCVTLNIPVMIFWGGNHYASNLPDSSCWIVWDKDNTGNFADAELAWTNQKTAVRIFKHTWNGLIKASERGEKRCHPTQKPIALAEWCFDMYGKESKSVMDLFGGSGSTLIACEKTNRKCFMMELDPHYCDVIVARWEKYSGQKARLSGQETGK